MEPTPVPLPRLRRILLWLLGRDDLRDDAAARERAEAFARSRFVFVLLVCFLREDFFLGISAVYH